MTRKIEGERVEPARLGSEKDTFDSRIKGLNFRVIVTAPFLRKNVTGPSLIFVGKIFLFSAWTGNILRGKKKAPIFFLFPSGKVMDWPLIVKILPASWDQKH